MSSETATERGGIEVQRIMSGRLDDLAAEAARTASPVFRKAAWTWRDIGVPDEAQIAATIRALVESASKMDEGTSSTGRLHVAHYEEDGRDIYSVSMTLAEIIGPEAKGPAS